MISIFRWVVSLAIVACVSLGIFYTRYEAVATRLQYDLGMDAEHANAVKHAYAAYQMYRLFDLVLDDQKAEHAVFVLGKVNEKFEQAVKFNNPDTTEEMMKDMHNNQAGIIAARWAASHPASDNDSLDLILEVARKGGLILSPNQIPVEEFDAVLPMQPHSIGTAHHWVNERRKDIVFYTETILSHGYATDLGATDTDLAN